MPNSSLKSSARREREGDCRKGLRRSRRQAGVDTRVARHAARGRHAGDLEARPAGAVAQAAYRNRRRPEGQGIGLLSPTDAIDTSSPGGMLVFHMLGARAKGGRPRRLTEKDTAAAKALLADGSLASKEIVARFGVSKATLYRYLD